MAILAIDTSTIVSGAAIVQKDKLVAEIIMQLKLPQSEVLLGHVQDVLKIAHMDKSDLTGVAISIGPGSFTGLRIGLATAKICFIHSCSSCIFIRGYGLSLSSTKCICGKCIRCTKKQCLFCFV